VALHFKKILITAGPTREMLDPVRFLTNLSTGEMGYALARKAVSKGYQVSLVSGPTDLQPPRGVKFYSVVSAVQMKRACEKLFPKHDGLIMTAAVCDFMPDRTNRHKIPSAKGLTLKLRRTPDILASLAKRKGRRTVIGFCLETQNLVRCALGKLIRKRLDGIVANFYDSDRHIPFGKRHVEVCLISADGRVCKLARQSKNQVAKALLSWMERLHQRRGRES